MRSVFFQFEIETVWDTAGRHAPSALHGIAFEPLDGIVVIAIDALNSMPGFNHHLLDHPGPNQPVGLSTHGIITHHWTCHGVRRQQGNYSMRVYNQGP